jgi:hypothetical protein
MKSSGYYKSNQFAHDKHLKQELKRKQKDKTVPKEESGDK